ncbi:MAG: hypothetical protein K1X36_10340 [Pyrinomonadaceae bacterium]|nr:hypothetical protein [Pyrinomonadaceae bacterium]
MAEELIVNPCLQFQPYFDDSTSFLLYAPKPGSGMKYLVVKRDEYPNVFDVFLDLSASRFDFLDPELDLDEADRDLLVENGVLVNSAESPELPLFSCQLSEFDPFQGDFDLGSLIAHPGIRFSPFDLGNFHSISQELHISPFSASVWIRDDLTGIEQGIWLSDSDAEVVSRLTASRSPNFPIDIDLARRLISAGILIDPLELRRVSQLRGNEIEVAQAKFQKDHYSVLKELFPGVQMRAMQRYYRAYVANGFMPFGDDQVERRYREHNEPFARLLQNQFASLMSLIAGVDVKLSYVYAASYVGGSVLAPHVDRKQCEYSISFQVDYEPEPPSGISPWAIYVTPLLGFDDAAARGETVTLAECERQAAAADPAAVNLANGDGLFYMGRELIHFRNELPDGHRSTSLFFHFVSVDFEGPLD